MDALVDAEASGDHRSALLLQINKVLQENISEMMKVIKGRREGQRKSKITRGLAERVNQDVMKDRSETESEERAKQLTTEEKLTERVRILLDDDENLSEEEAKELAAETIDFKVDLSTADWPGSLFLDRKPVANASIGIINRNTRFYEEFWNYLEEHSDRKGFEALEVLVMSLVRAEDELVREYDSDIFARFRERWGYWSEKLIKHAGS
jgi:hypothetical protein